jgi:hypothetical protein
MADVLTNLQQGAVGKEGNILDYTYYDTISLLSTTQVFNMFAIPNGQGGKNLSDTNMTVAASLPQGQRLNVGAIKMMYTFHAVFNEATLQLFYTALQNISVEMIIMNQDYGRWTLMELIGSAVCGIGVPAVAGNNDTLLSQAKYHGIFPLNVPIKLPALNQFSLRITAQVATNAALDGDKLKVGLSGILEMATA